MILYVVTFLATTYIYISIECLYDVKYSPFKFLCILSYRLLIWIQLICLYYKHIVKRGNYHVSAKSNLVEKSLFVLLHLVMQNPKKVIVRLSPNCFFVLTLFLLIIVCHLSHCSTSKYYLHIKTHVFYFLYYSFTYKIPIK